MNESLHYLLNNMYRGLIVFFVLLVSILVMSSCGSGVSPPSEVPPRDKVLPDSKTSVNGGLLRQDEYFVDSWNSSEDTRNNPHISDLKVTSRRGEGTGSNPRILAFQATLKSYPADIVCEGEYLYVRGDPFYARWDWYSLEGVVHSIITSKARYYLFNTGGPPACQNKLVLLVLKRWIEEGKINYDDIPNKQVVDSLEILTNKPEEIPDWLTNAGFIDFSNIQTHDLVPELPQNAKVPRYILHSDGILAQYLIDSESSESDESELLLLRRLNLPLNCNFALSNPIQKPTK